MLVNRCILYLIFVGCKANGIPCIFPFNYGGVTYNECTNATNGKLWCATHLKSDGNGTYSKWGYCDANCTITVGKEQTYHLLENLTVLASDKWLGRV